MAKENNLGDLLEGIANAIQTKGGTTAPINAQNFEKAILDLPSGGGVDLTRIGYTQESSKEYNVFFENGLQYAEQIARTWEDIGNITSKYSNDSKLLYFPQVLFNNTTIYNSFCEKCPNLQLFPNFSNNNNIKYGGYAFFSCRKLKQIGNIYKVSTLNYVCYNCFALLQVGIIDIENCTNFNSAFINDGELHTISFQKYKKMDFSLSTLKSLSIASINYLIEHAIGADGSAEQRTLTLEATAKKRWQDPTQNPQYEYYAAMAAEKLITIA